MCLNKCKVSFYKRCCILISDRIANIYVVKDNIQDVDEGEYDDD